MLTRKLRWIIPSLKINNFSMSCRWWMPAPEESENMSCGTCGLGGDTIIAPIKVYCLRTTGPRLGGAKRAHTAGTRGVPALTQLSCGRVISSINQLEWWARCISKCFRVVLNEKRRQGEPRASNLVFSADNVFSCTSDGNLPARRDNSTSSRTEIDLPQEIFWCVTLLAA